MSVLSTSIQKQVEDNLVVEGLLTADKLKDLKEKAESTNTPFLGLLVSEGHISNEILTKAIATATNVPYVNLTNVHVDPKTLDILPQDIAERYMAVPLGELKNRLVVAMLDADNV